MLAGKTFAGRPLLSQTLMHSFCLQCIPALFAFKPHYSGTITSCTAIQFCCHKDIMHPLKVLGTKTGQHMTKKTPGVSYWHRQSCSNLGCTTCTRHSATQLRYVHPGARNSCWQLWESVSCQSVALHRWLSKRMKVGLHEANSHR